MTVQFGPDELQAGMQRGIAALESGDLKGAEAILGALAQAHPSVPDVWNLLSVVAVRAGAAEESVKRVKHAIALDRRNPIYHNNLGIANGELDRLDDAEAAFRRALTLNPAYPHALYNLGKILHKKGRLTDSQRAYERAYAMAPELEGGNLRCNLAQIYQLQGQSTRAVALLRESPGIPDEAFASTYAACLAEAEGADAALAWISWLLAQRPNLAQLRFERGIGHLGLGNWREGWTDYAWRPHVPAAGRLDPRNGALPAKLDQVRVLVRSEQGLGDALFFLRFVHVLRQRGARVSFHCPSALVSVLRASAVADEIIDESAAPDPRSFELSVFAGDLPALLPTDPPAPLRLRWDADALAIVRGRFAGDGPGPYLALTWRAGTDVVHGAEYGRRNNVLSKEVPLQAMIAAVRSWPGTLVALQRGVRPGELEAASREAGKPVYDYSDLNADLVHMTAALSVVDEYVAVSNTNIHLRAGVGRTARVLVPRPPEWRWMTSGERSPWFPDMRVYRQPISRDWSEPLAALQRDLSP